MRLSWSTESILWISIQVNLHHLPHPCLNIRLCTYTSMILQTSRGEIILWILTYCSAACTSSVSCCHSSSDAAPNRIWMSPGSPGPISRPSSLIMCNAYRHSKSSTPCYRIAFHRLKVIYFKTAFKYQSFVTTTSGWWEHGEQTEYLFNSSSMPGRLMLIFPTRQIGLNACKSDDPAAVRYRII